MAEDDAGAAGRSESRPDRRSRVQRRFLAIAAMAGAVALGLSALRHVQGPDDEFSLGSGEYVSGANETTTATLADGSIVRLGPNSRLRIHDVPGGREVFLSGRAYLAVAPMSDRPFYVRTAAGDLKVLGTRFDVQATDELRVVVVEGQVQLGTDREQVQVGTGEMSMIANGEVMPPVEVDVRPFVAWVGEFLAFQETPLRKVARELEQEYGTQVVLTDSSIAGVTITGWYIDRSFEEVIVIICGVLRARCSVENDTATIGW